MHLKLKYHEFGKNAKNLRKTNLQRVEELSVLFKLTKIMYKKMN